MWSAGQAIRARGPSEPSRSGCSQVLDQLLFLRNVRSGVKSAIFSVERSLSVFADKQTISEPRRTSHSDQSRHNSAARLAGLAVVETDDHGGIGDDDGVA